jgi:hypothetical protein
VALAGIVMGMAMASGAADEFGGDGTVGALSQTAASGALSRLPLPNAGLDARIEYSTYLGRQR